jgi:hypothetical protein
VNSPKTVTSPPVGLKSDETSLDTVSAEHEQALALHRLKNAIQNTEITTQSLPLELQRVVQILCDTYEAIDLRIETTFGTAETDFLSAMPEVKGHEVELLQLVRLLMADLKTTIHTELDHPLLLRFTYQDKVDLVEQLLSGAKARLVVMPVENDVSLHANIKGFRK